MSEEAGEHPYHDVIKNEMRRRRGKAKRARRGPYSREENALIEASRRMVVAERLMHGELAQPTCADLALILIRARVIIEKYSYENYPDPIRDGIDPHVVARELDAMPLEATPEDVDIYKEIRDAMY